MGIIFFPANDVVTDVATDTAMRALATTSFTTGDLFYSQQSGLYRWDSDASNAGGSDLTSTGGTGLYRKQTNERYMYLDSSNNLSALNLGNSSIDLNEGNILIGNSSNVASALDVSGNTKIVVGNGTTATSVAISGFITMTNAGVTSAALAQGSIFVGNGSGVAAAVDAKTSGQILVGSGTTVASVAVSGHATLAANGALTLASAILTGTYVATVANANVIGGIPVIFRIDTAGGATANTDVTVTNKIRVIDAWVVNRAAGTASDTIQVFNGASAISNAIDISGGDKTIARAGEMDDAAHEIAASGTLRITETDGGGSDSPATTVYVKALRVA